MYLLVSSDVNRFSRFDIGANAGRQTNVNVPVTNKDHGAAGRHDRTLTLSASVERQCSWPTQFIC